MDRCHMGPINDLAPVADTPGRLDGYYCPIHDTKSRYF
jgi:hypothetical protein